MRTRRTAFAATLALGSLATCILAQTGVESNLPGAGFDTPQSSAPTIHVYSRETIVDVLVTDDKGQPVRGLTRSDFTVLEDGQPQPIHGFSEYDKAVPPARTLPPNTYTNSTALPANGPVQLLYFDIPCLASFPPGSDPIVDTAAGQIVIRAKKYIAEYLRTMPAGTEAAVFAFRCDYGLRLVQGFTTDGERAAAAVDNLVVLSQGPPPSFDPIAAADQIAAFVAGIHGRKNLIWIGSPLPIMRDGGYSWGNLDMTLVHRLMDTYDLFTREQIAIYPLHPEGVHKLGPTVAPKMNTLAQAQAFLANAEGPLAEAAVAEATGGATSNSNDYKSTIADIVDRTSHLYTLSYVPTRPDEDGRFHPIRIAVNRPGLHLNYRPGYNDEQPGPPDAILRQQMIQGPMRLGAIPATQILFDLRVNPVSAQPVATPASVSTQPVATPVSAPAHTKVISYDTVFTLDPTQIALTETPDGLRTANIELDLGAYDFYGKLVASRSQTFRLTVTPAQSSGVYRFHLSLAIDLPRGQLTLRAGVFDTSTGKAGTVETPLTVPKDSHAR